MSSSKRIIDALIPLGRALLKALSSRSSRSENNGSGRSVASETPARRPRLKTPQDSSKRSSPVLPSGEEEDVSPGQNSSSQTVQVYPEDIGDLAISYAPDKDGDPDAGEVIWTWVPYAENDGRGKDRPVLVIGRQSRDRVYAVRMTSKDRDGERDFLSIGSGAWDSQGRESWVDVEQLYSVHESGMRREAATLDKGRFTRVAEALRARYGWSVDF